MDMTGNVSEWVSDWYSGTAYADAGSMHNPEGPVSGSYRVVRGGSFFNFTSYLRSASRDIFNPADAGASRGFRCAR